MVAALALFVEDQGGIATDAVISSDQAASDQGDSDLSRSLGLHDGSGSIGGLRIRVDGILRSGTPAIAAQFGQYSDGCATFASLLQPFLEPVGSIVRIEGVADQGDGECFWHAQSVAGDLDLLVQTGDQIRSALWHMAESGAHRELKRLAARWLREQSYVAVGMEVADATGRFRVDVAGWTDRRTGQRGRVTPRTVVVECKQSRSDYLRDGSMASGLLARRADLIEELRDLGAKPAVLFTRRNQTQPTLFDHQPLDPRRPGRQIRRLRLELAAIERRVYRGVKFARLARWRGATHLWVAAPSGMISPAELPMGWGLLEVPQGPLEYRVSDAIAASSVIQVRLNASEFSPTASFQDRLLRNIAVSNSRFVGGRTVRLNSQQLMA